MYNDRHIIPKAAKACRMSRGGVKGEGVSDESRWRKDDQAGRGKYEKKGIGP